MDVEGEVCRLPGTRVGGFWCTASANGRYQPGLDSMLGVNGRLSLQIMFLFSQVYKTLK